jgi:hypothetical protein
MLKEIHEHIRTELQQNARTDTIFMVTAVVYNLVSLGINSAVGGDAGSPYSDSSTVIIFWVFILVNLIVNGIALAGLNYGKQMRGRLLSGLIAMYRDNQVEKYYDESMLKDYNTRYTLFMAIIGVLGGMAILVPLILYFV